MNLHIQEKPPHDSGRVSVSSCSGSGSSSPFNDGSFLVILKIRGSDIHFQNLDNISKGTYKAHSFRILCRNLEARNDLSDTSIRVFVLDELASTKCDTGFQQQETAGELVGLTDMALFMTSPLEKSEKLSYAIDIGIESRGSSTEDLGDDCFKRLGSAYFFLDTDFSTQGVQRMQVMSTYNKCPIGHIQVEYLVVKNPVASGVKVPMPQWLKCVPQLDAGHRGAGSGCRADLPGAIQENTVASFNYAARHGADMCELDVMCTSDGIPIVFHNYTLTTDVRQIDQLTLKELRAMKENGIHDKDCKHDCDASNIKLIQENNKPFPTLEEVLRNVDKDCALNIELKWPQLLPNGKTEATQFREINDFVDRILSCIYEYSSDRKIVLSTLSADIAIMLRLKQSRYPVLFLTTGDSQRFEDPTTKTIKNAIHFAKAFDMAGINPNAAYLNEYLVRYAKERGLLVYAWGKIESAQAIKELRNIGLDGVIYDKIDLIKPQD